MPFIINPKTGNAQHTSDDFIVCDDLQGKDTPLTILKIESKEATLNEGRKCQRIHVYFKGAKKPLLLNSTNTRTIIAMYGKKAADWIDKIIILFPDICKFKGVPTDCIRIRLNKQANAAPAHPQQLQPATTGATSPGTAQEPQVHVTTGQ